MTAQTKKLAILFADISGSTALYEKHGDLLARQLIARCIGLMKDTLNEHKGTLIKTIGDEILCTFPSAEIAMNAASDMQRKIKDDNQKNEHPMYIRIGFNYGDVICEEGDIYGDAVNVAARVAAITRANQIMTTSAVVDALPLTLHDQVRKILRADLKGKQEQLDIFQVMWEMEDMSSTRIGLSAFRKPPAEGAELTLTYSTRPYLVNDKNKKLSMGRDETCNILVKNDFVSRQHADIEFRFGNFILSDHSSNGTYIRTGESIVRLSREDTILRGSGFISLGQPYLDNPADLIEFMITHKQ